MVARPVGSLQSVLRNADPALYFAVCSRLKRISLASLTSISENCHEGGVWLTLLLPEKTVDSILHFLPGLSYPELCLKLFLICQLFPESARDVEEGLGR